MAIFSKGCNQYYDFGSPNSLMLCFTNIWGLLCWLWIFPWIQFSWHFCSMWEKPGWFWQFHGEGLFSLGVGFLSQENSADSYLCFRLALLHSVSCFFFLYWLPSSFLCTVFASIFFYQNDVRRFTNNIYDIKTIKIKET